VLSADSLSPGERIALTFQNEGMVDATVESVGSEGRPSKPAPGKATRKKPKPKTTPVDDPQGSLL